MDNNEKRIVYKAKEEKKNVSETVGIVIPEKIKTVYLPEIADFNGNCNFEYSFDNKKFIAFGGISQLSWANYRGTRFGIYNFNSRQEAGFVDVDWFVYPIEIDRI